MYTPAYLVRLAALAGSLPAGSPARVAAAYHLKIAGRIPQVRRNQYERGNREFDEYVLGNILLGLMHRPPNSYRKGEFLSLVGEAVQEQKLSVDSAKAFREEPLDFLRTIFRSAMKVMKADEDKAEELVNKVVVSNMFYGLGRNLHGAISPSSIRNALSRYVFRLGISEQRDTQKQVGRDVAFDPTPSDDEGEGRTLAETLTRSEALSDVALIFNTPQGRSILQKLDAYVDFSDAASQQAVWDAIKDNTSLIESNTELAEAYYDRTGKDVSPQAVGQIRFKVLKRLQAAVLANPDLQADFDLLMESGQLRLASAKKKRLAALLRAASVIKTSYDEGMLDDALKLLTETDTAMHDLANLLDARHGGERSVSDAFNTASDLSRWLRGDASKQFDTYANKFREQARKAK